MFLSCTPRAIRPVRAASLRAAGITPRDRVAVVLPDGPEMAGCFLSVASCAACAPLNPRYRESEFRFYLEDLRPKALLVAADSDSPAISVAQDLGIQVLRLRTCSSGLAGMFYIDGLTPSESAVDWPIPGDVALVLHTSGTTSRPKMVPLTQANLRASGRNIAATLELTPQDRCLNVMPLFHIHGLLGVLLGSMAAGAQVVLTPGFLAPEFFGWLRRFQPTWYSAVPTMHQSILARATENAAILGESRLRFLRSSSAALAPQVLEQLERTFRAPVVEAYGMTEAAHQMASNPLPPLPRKRGSVGPSAGPEVAIMDEAGNLLSAGTIGEVVIRGENVTVGYVNNPQANESAFTGGWFRTGDQGRMDDDGYLYLTGRLKEIINRGGEKISPREVDEVLLSHPAVSQAVAFAMPDARLGEDVAAAVVLRGREVVDELELRDFAADRLADFKVPRRIVFLDEIPKGPTGKLQRIGLAEKLGLDKPESVTERTASAPAAQEGDDLEQRLAGIWQKVLGVPAVGLDENFLNVGGDSILAGRLLTKLDDEFGRAPTMVQFFDLLSVRKVAAWFRQSSDRHKDACRLNHPDLNEASRLPEPLSATPASRMDGTQRKVAALFEQVLHVQVRGHSANFFELGGDSSLALRLAGLMQKELGCQIALAEFCRDSSVAALARLVEGPTSRHGNPSLFLLQEGSSGPPVFLVHAADGGLGQFLDLASLLAPKTGVYGLRSPALEDRRLLMRTVSEMATAYLKEIRTVQPHGPYRLVGHCFGCTVAMEMARQIGESGEELALLAMTAMDGNARTASSPATSLGVHVRYLKQSALADGGRYVASRLAYRLRRIRVWCAFPRWERRLAAGGEFAADEWRAFVAEVNHRAGVQWKPLPVQAGLVYFQASSESTLDSSAFWGPLALRGFRLVSVPASTPDLFSPENAGEFARALETEISRPRSNEALSMNE